MWTFIVLLLDKLKFFSRHAFEKMHRYQNVNKLFLFLCSVINMEGTER